MTTNSTIDPTTINATFPTAGVSNDTQPFRDNFTAIKLNLRRAKDELSQFLSHGVLDNTPVTSFNNNIIRNGSFRAASDYRYRTVGLQLSDFTVNYTNGSYQEIAIGASVTINLSNFPVDTGPTRRLGLIRVAISAVGEDQLVSFSAGSNVLKYDGDFPLTNNKLKVKGTPSTDVPTAETMVDIWQVNHAVNQPVFCIKYVGLFQAFT